MRAIKVNDISKKFGSFYALENIQVDFEFGKIYGLLGRNGAGKSTLLNVMSNRLFPTAGSVTLEDMPVKENDQALGKIFLMNDLNLFPKSMKIKQAFQWTERFYGGFDHAFCQELCEVFQLNPKKKVNSLSTGYQSIFKLIIALCVKADYIFLDEPVLGLDANHRDLFYKMLLRSFEEQPRTFILSTHIIEEVAGLIEHVVIIKKGHLLCSVPTEELLASGYTVTGGKDAVLSFTSNKEVISKETFGGLITVCVKGQMPTERPEGLTFDRLDLQKLFIQLTATEKERGL